MFKLVKARCSRLFPARFCFSNHPLTMQEAHPYSKNPIREALLPPRRVMFIINPKAGTSFSNSVEDSIDRFLNHRRFTYTLRYTEKPGHAADLARQAINELFDIVVAVGGDGSINEVASALMHTDTVLGIVPAGSGNGLAMHLGYGRDISQAVRLLNTAEVRSIDCGTLNGLPFFNLAGVGFDGLVSNLMKGQQLRGLIPYFFKSVEAGFTYVPRRCQIQADDRHLDISCFAISIANGPMYGYNFQIAPDAVLDDGNFSVVILKKAPKWQYVAAVPATLNGRIYDAEFVEHFKAKRILVSSEGENFVHLDGEGMIVKGDLMFEIHPRAIKILVPQTPNAPPPTEFIQKKQDGQPQ